MPEKYDSTEDTLQHIATVQRLMRFMTDRLFVRANVHDQSKLIQPEKAIFDEFTPKLRGSTYGSDEYQKHLSAMRVALDHHYSMNSHHPEHFPNGIRGMTLLDLMEMFCDWKAATLRHADGDIVKSIAINQKRFGYSDELAQIFLNTLKEFGETVS